ncbi:MAG: hypothetical protein K2P58_02275 [Hyphomonadaceae bacterium]|nr:hypothetical protein [Hyphomonadaceae bacterium]
MITNPRTEAEHALKQAQRAAKRGDIKEAERWSKTAERMVAAAEKLRALPAPEAEPDEEALRAELRARLRRLADAAYDLDRWQEERDQYEAAVGKAVREGAPMPDPLRPCPGDEAYLEKIGRGEIKE